METRSSQSLPLTHIAHGEPFGQTGVRQYFFKALWTTSLILMLFCGATWVRSYWSSDSLAFGSGRQIVMIRSLTGRMTFSATTYPYDISRFRRGITFDAQPVPQNIIDRWEPSIWKTMGIEARGEPFQPRAGATGVWLRAKWPTMMVLLGTLPAINGLAFIARRTRRLVFATKSPDLLRLDEPSKQKPRLSPEPNEARPLRT